MDRDEELLPVRIFNICPYVDAQQATGTVQSFLVFLKGEGRRVVPIAIGQFEGQALVMALRKIPLPRPLPHNLLVALLEKMNAAVRRLVIHTLRDDVFHACLLIETSEATFELDCRPSDGMILATLSGTPLFMTPEVMEEAGRDLEVITAAQDTATAEKPASGDAAAAPQDLVGAREANPAVPHDKSPVTELERLNQQLARLIAEEAYEEAAKVRDRIRALAAK